MDILVPILIVLAILALAALLVICWLLFMLACAKEIPSVMAPMMSGLIGGFHLDELDMVKEGHAFYDASPKEKWYVTSYDGLKLKADFIPCENARATIILMHGYRSSAMHDFSGVLPYYHSLGLNILLCDQRAHGESEGKYIGYGVVERYDLLSWAEEHNKRIGTDTPIILDGISMGGATVIFSTSLEFPENVRGMIDDCGYYSAKDQITYVMGLLKLPVFPFYHLANAMCKLIAGFSFSDVDAREHLSKTRIPILFIHGEADDFVPVDMGKACYDSCVSKKSIFLCPEASHGMSYITQTEKCKEMLREFLDDVLA